MNNSLSQHQDFPISKTNAGLKVFQNVITFLHSRRYGVILRKENYC